MKNILFTLGVLSGFFGYGYIIVKTAVGTGEGLSFSTFLLWSMLAWITCGTLFRQKVNFAIPLVYACGATITTAILVYKGKVAWTSMDLFVAFLVGCCIYFWMTKGDVWAFVASVLAAVIAGIPFIIVTWKNPDMSPIIANTSFLVANTFGFLSAKTWKIEDRLYTGLNIVVTGLLVLPYFLYR